MPTRKRKSVSQSPAATFTPEELVEREKTKVLIETDLSDTAEYLSIPCQDLNLYFQSTYLKVGLPEEQNFQWMFVNGFLVAEGDNPVTINHSKIELKGLLQKSSQQSVGFRLNKIEIDFSFPEVGLYNYKNSAVLFLRRNNRQNKKGLCEDTGYFVPVQSFYSPFVSFPLGFSLRNVWRWNTANLNATFLHSNYVEFTEAFEKIRRLKCLAKALSRNFLLGQGLTGKEPSLWFRKTLIGTALSTERVQICNPLFLQEALDFFNPQGVSVVAA